MSAAVPFLAVSCLLVPAGAGDFYRPLYLVEGQMVPYALKTSLSVAPADFDHRSVEVDANLIPILNGRHVLSTLGGGYYSESFTDGETDDNVPGRMTGAYGSLFATGDFLEKWYWVAYGLYGSFGRSLSDSWGEQDRWLAMGGTGYKLSPNLSFGALVLYASNFGEPFFLPLPMFSWSSGRFLTSVAPPGLLEVRFNWTERFRTLAIARFPSFAFYLPREDDVLTWSSAEVQAIAEIKLFTWTYLQPNVSWMPWDEISWRDDSYPATGFSQSMRVALSLLLVVD